jgi:hypothetical protein
MRLLAIMTSLLLSSCLVPQSVEPDTTRPHTVPRVDRSQLPSFFLQPSILLYPRGSSDIAANCHCHLQLPNITIIAEDPTVNVEGRWFVDYDISVPRSQAPFRHDTLVGDFITTDTTRQYPSVGIDADALGLTTGSHVIQLVLAEQAGFAPPETPPPNQAVLPSYESSVFQFVVQVQAEPDPARLTCASVPPPSTGCP